MLKGRDFTWIYTITCFSQVNQDYVVTVLGVTCIADRITWSLFALPAVTFTISPVSTINGFVNISVGVLADMVFWCATLNVASKDVTICIVMVDPLPLSSLTNIDFTIAVVAEGTVYSVVALVVVKSTFYLQIH